MLDQPTIAFAPVQGLDPDTPRAADRDLKAALRELAQINEVLLAAYHRRDEDDSAEANHALEVVNRAFQATYDRVVAMPIQGQEDVTLKAAFLIEYCNLEPTEIQTVLLDIAAFCRGGEGDVPSLADMLG